MDFTPAIDGVKSRNWAGTLNNWTEEEHAALLATPGVKYICIGKEIAPTTGTPHLQMCIYFTGLKRLKTMKEMNPRANWGTLISTQELLAKYCQKDGDFVEVGKYVTPKQKGVGEKRRWQEAWDNAEAGNMEAIDPQIRIQCYTTLKKIHHDHLLSTCIPTMGEIEHEWYCGEAGTGKSRKAREENPDAYLKMCNKWWDGYAGEEVVLLEDFDKRHEVLCHHLKIWGDRYAFIGEAKGSSMKIRPRKIIVTSNRHPDEIWTEQADLEPILRRFKVTRFNKL